MERHVARAKGSISKASVASASGHTVRDTGGAGGGSAPALAPGAEGSLPHSQSTPVVQVSKSVFATPRAPAKDPRRPTTEEEELPRRERDFLFYFGHLKEKLIDHTSCACQGEDDMLVRHGRIFITENHICFSSHIIGEYLKEIPFGGVQQIAKKNTAFVVPNAISVKHTHGTEFFSSMSGRDRIFDLLNTLWHKKQGEKSLGINLKSLTETARLESAKKHSSAESPALAADNPFRTSGKHEGRHTPSIAVSPPSEAEIPMRKGSKESVGKGEGEGQSGRKNSKPLDLSVFKNSMGGEEGRGGSALKSPRSPHLSQGSREGKSDEEGEGKKEEKEKESGTDWVEGKKVNFNEESLRGSGLAIGGKSALQMGKLPQHGEFDGHLQLPENSVRHQQLLQEVLPCAKVSHFYASFLFNANKFWNVLLRKAGHFNIQVQQWHEAGPHHYARALSMTAPLRSFPGLGHVRVRQEHQLSSPRSGLLVFDIRSRTEGETYSGAYEIWSRWEVEEKEGQCVVTVRQHTEHLKKTWVAHVLEGNARDQTVIFLHKWLLRAREQLKNEENEKLEAEQKRKALVEAEEGDNAKANALNGKGARTDASAVLQSSATDGEGGIDLGAILDAIPLPSMEGLMETSATMLSFALLALFLIVGALYLSYAMSVAEQRLQVTSSQFAVLEERAKFLLSFSARTQSKINALRESHSPSDPLSFSGALADSWRAEWLPLEASWEVEEWQRTLSRIGADVARVAHTMAEEMALLSSPASVVAPAEHLHRISGSHQALLRSLDQVRLAAPPVAVEGYSYVTLLATFGTVAVGVLYAVYA